MPATRRTACSAPSTASAPTEPIPCEHCQFCAFRPMCEQALGGRPTTSRAWPGCAATRSPLLAAAGVTTLDAARDAAGGSRPCRTAAGALGALTQQARLQQAAVAGAAPPYELLPVEDGRGFALLPEPSPGRRHVRLRGRPVLDAGAGTDVPRRPALPRGRRLALRGDLGARPRRREGRRSSGSSTCSRRGSPQYPDMHVYHYSAAEPSVVKQLMAQHATREAEVDDLLRREVFVDLLTVTSRRCAPACAATRSSRPSGSPGSCARPTWARAPTPCSATSAGATSRRPGRARRDRGLQRGGLPRDRSRCATGCSAIRPPGITGPRPIASGASARGDAEARRRARAAARRAHRRRAAGLAALARRRAARVPPPRGPPRVVAATSRCREMDESELHRRQRGARAGSSRSGEPRDVAARASSTTCASPRRSTRSSRDRGSIRRPARASTSARSTTTRGTLVMRRGKALRERAAAARADPGRAARHEGAARARSLRLAVAVRDGERALPRAAGRARQRSRRGSRASPPARRSRRPSSAAARRLARALDESTLVVQGPPGTGKTWLGARLIVDLIARGKRVGVTAMSHKAIDNLLGEVERAADEDGVAFRGRAQVSAEGSRVPDDWRTQMRRRRRPRCFDPGYELVAGTSWLFAPERADEQLDYLVIDEAGQLSLADALAAGTAARNLILLGDPLQLPHVSQAVHPEGTSLSVLAAPARRAPDRARAERGLFLEQTRRMHPGRLRVHLGARSTRAASTSHPDCARQSVGGEAGIRYLPVAARRQRVVVARGGRGDPRRDRAPARPAVPRHATAASARWRRDDCMVVTPYNLQRAPAAQRAARRRAHRHRRQLPGPGGAGRLLLDGDLERRGRAARRRASCSAATASTSRSAGRAAWPISCARRRCSRRTPRRSSRCG